MKTPNCSECIWVENYTVTTYSSEIPNCLNEVTTLGIKSIPQIESVDEKRNCKAQGYKKLSDVYNTKECRKLCEGKSIKWFVNL